MPQLDTHEAPGEATRHVIQLGIQARSAEDRHGRRAAERAAVQRQGNPQVFLRRGQGLRLSTQVEAGRVCLVTPGWPGQRQLGQTQVAHKVSVRIRTVKFSCGSLFNLGKVGCYRSRGDVGRRSAYASSGTAERDRTCRARERARLGRGRLPPCGPRQAEAEATAPAGAPVPWAREAAEQSLSTDSGFACRSHSHVGHVLLCRWDAQNGMLDFPQAHGHRPDEVRYTVVEVFHL
mmetsp:Transcript_84812/g.152822  ORF Transcript_84812/g.152822 Transcript_84812/m.152822 type:complete len:234 (+) Transcript_84812:513-1214(+)